MYTNLHLEPAKDRDEIVPVKETDEVVVPKGDHVLLRKGVVAPVLLHVAMPLAEGLANRRAGADVAALAADVSVALAPRLLAVRAVEAVLLASLTLVEVGHRRLL